MSKKILSFIIFLLVAFAAYLIINTISFKSKHKTYAPAERISISDSAVYRLTEAIQHKTISTEDNLDFDSLEFRKFGAFLSSTYPLIDQKLSKETINQFSYLYTWHGTDPSLKPILLLGHYAVAGMAGIFASTVRAPLTGLMLAIEMTSNFELILPLIITTVTAAVFTALIGNKPIYTTLLKRILDNQETAKNQ